MQLIASVSLFILFLQLFQHNVALQLSYQSLIDLRANCSTLDTCEKESLRSRSLDSVKERNCACDKNCAIFGDCCINAKYVGLMPTFRQKWECREMRQFGGIYMRSSCPPNFKNFILKTKCENDTLPSDPLSSLPVTNVQSKITYKNIHCALCNDDFRNVTFWNPRIECKDLPAYNRTFGNLTESFILQNLVYFEENNRWGVNLDFPYWCDIDPVFPEILLHHLRFCKSGLISDCPKNWKDENVRKACNSYQALVYDIGKTKFWNPHCALCNGVHATNTSRLICRPVEGRDKESDLDSRSSFNPTAFALLFDVNSFSSGNNIVGQKVMCSRDYQVYDPFLKFCRNIFCGFEDYKLLKGKCIRQENKSRNEMQQTSRSHKDAANFNRSQAMHSSEFISCPKIEINEENFFVLKNNSVYIKLYSKLFSEWKYSDDGKSILVCSSLASTSSKFDFGLEIVTNIGLLLSIVCLSLHLTAFFFVSEIRNLSGFNLASFSFALIVAYSCFITSQLTTVQKSITYCKALAIVMYYFFFLSFQWMSVMSFDVWRTLRQATIELRIPTGKQKLRFTLYTLYCALSTAAIVSLAVTADQYPNLVPLHYQPSFGTNQRCWFAHRKSLIVFFFAPVGLIILSNAAFFVLTALIIVRNNCVSATKTTNSSRKNFKLYLRLCSLMGLSWIAGFLATLADNIYLWYLFVLLNTSQGLFIFLSFTCNKKVINSLKNRLTKSRTPITSNLVGSSKPYSSHSNLSTHLTYLSHSTASSKDEPAIKLEHTNANKRGM
ncbi:G-protein coupled receptor Mth2-like protein [Dinothrombium tinctorium]|uniref:G-protein coupled receptor Mth2-like protein n=1 Tax=Dinothrombium tinctorium TaxID=1965070 RepID=A0A3S3S4B0_9ACAR|nr:G-protein coupled receptor Mth2-like protein [Dinothrombium tinctorium]